MLVVHGIEQLTPEHGPVFVVVGAFDGLHLGHLYLIEHLVGEAHARAAQPTVITFDHHPDAVLIGRAPPLLLEPSERLERLAAAGVAVTTIEHFDEALRRTPYDAFVERIRARLPLRGFLMTPDAAIGFKRRGTPTALAALGARDAFDVVVVPPFTLDGHAVRSTDIRAEIAAGNLAGAAALLGRPLTFTGMVEDGGPDGLCLGFELPVALPPAGEYSGRAGPEPVSLRIDRETVYIRGNLALGAWVTVELTGEAATGVP